MSQERNREPRSESREYDFWDGAIGIGAAAGIIIAGTEILLRIHEQNPEFDSTEVFIANLGLGVVSALTGVGVTMASRRIRGR